MGMKVNSGFCLTMGSQSIGKRGRLRLTQRAVHCQATYDERWSPMRTGVIVPETYLTPASRTL